MAVVVVILDFERVGEKERERERGERSCLDTGHKMSTGWWISWMAAVLHNRRQLVVWGF